jgi:multidrug efflux pump
VNLLTLLAIVLSVGLVVDDAIVVVENVERHIREGKTRLEASLIGARELVGPIIAMTITLAAVYAPIGFQGGLTGALFREFAFTLAGAVFISGVVALTLSPMMSSRLLNPTFQPTFLPRLIDRGFEAVKRTYERMLAGTLKARGAVYLVWGVLTILIVPLYMFSKQELAPNEDQGVVFTSFDVPANATLEQLVPYTDQVNRIFQSEPEFDHSFQITFPTAGFGGMLAKPWDERKRSIFPIQDEVGKKLGAVAGVRAPAFLPGALPSAGFLPIEFVISSTGTHEELVRYADQLVQEAVKSGKFFFPPMTDVRIDQAKADIVIDRDKAASMGLNMQQVGADLSSMIGGNFVNRFNIDGRAYKVIPQIERAGRLTPDQLRDIHITGPGGSLIPLSAIGTLREGVEPRSLNRFQQLNSIKLMGVSQSVDDGLKVLEEASARIMPPGSRVDYTGESRQLRQESGKFLPAMGLALVLIFLVLAAQFNSFRDPLVILAGSVPLAMFGALIFTFLKFPGGPGSSFKLTEGWTTTLNIYSQVGLVTLVGLVSKNGILIVEFANHAQQALGLAKIEAVKAAAATRLRPILMTTVATVVGHFPLTLVTGPGAVARNSIGIVLVGGMSIGTLFTLFVVPSVYVLLAKDHSHEREKAAAEESAAAVADGVAVAPAE